ncbi:MAG: protein-L-isoaspartate O-methyltransferase [Rhodobacteraceae bacterium]|jgi:protein-L-isoaspartate(D-aspartate) O-methyltransferase|nr:protein-L-isoaspartate O-methyltransferase [Paracoccaceae bacterium]
MTDFATRRTTMVDTQVRPSDVTKFPIIDAMLTVPREMFVPSDRIEAAYVGENLELGGGRVMLEARTLAKMLDALALTPADLVLVVGAGQGYSAAVTARMVNAVIALEEDAVMATEAERALAEVGADNVAVLTGPLAEGMARHAPYDAILIDGAIEVLPDALAAQLRDGGRIAALFREGNLGVCRIGIAQGGRIAWRHAFNAGAPVLPGFAAVRTFSL